MRGKDYEYEGEAATLSNMKNPMKGCGPFIHDDETDRPPERDGDLRDEFGRRHVLAVAHQEELSRRARAIEDRGDGVNQVARIEKAALVRDAGERERPAPVH